MHFVRLIARRNGAILPQCGSGPNGAWAADRFFSFTLPALGAQVRCKQTKNNKQKVLFVWSLFDWNR
jgi:hypothetical protein